MALPMLKSKVSGFSVPRCRLASNGISASLQQVLGFFAFLTPETW
jgi:hypothetical protein